MEKLSRLKETYSKAKEAIAEKSNKLFDGIKGLFAKKIKETVTTPSSFSVAKNTSGRIIALEDLPKSSTPLAPLDEKYLDIKEDIPKTVQKEHVLVGKNISDIKKEENPIHQEQKMGTDSTNMHISSFAKNLISREQELLGEQYLGSLDTITPARAIFSTDEKIKKFALHLAEKDNISVADQPEYVKNHAGLESEWDSSDKVIDTSTEKGLKKLITRARLLITDEKIDNETKGMLEYRKAKNTEFKTGLKNIEDMLNHDIPLEDITPYAEKLKADISEHYNTLEGLKEHVDTRALPSSEETLKFYKEYGIEKEQITLHSEKKHQS